ncbi:MAG: hypothetical protein JW863_11400 [Chitinispirillaceae bacterium]|nr:hypothetical protein [Chitinispirillaceae bacterium]
MSCFIKRFIFVLTAVRVLYSADVATLNKQGVEACNREEFEKAVPLLIDALHASPGNPTISKNLSAAGCALAYRQDHNGSPDTALATLRNIYSLIPGNSAVRNALVALLVNQGTIALRDNCLSNARHYTDEALLIAPANATACCLAGDIAYRQNDLPAARAFWEEARKSEPSNRFVAQRLERVGKDLDTERSFSSTEASHFDIRFDYRNLGNSIFDIRDFLMEAYNTVGQDLNLFPSHTVAVILYGEHEFRMTNNVPEFIAGLYDGKIRVPVDFSKYPLTTLKGILFHEYTHAVIHTIAGPSCPLWLNEGIAMREMKMPLPVQSDLVRRALSSGTTIPYAQLGDQSVWNDPSQVFLAYAQSWIMAEYLFHRWSNSQIRELLSRCKKGTPIETIMKEELGRTPEQFDREWKEYAKSVLH